MTTVPYSIGDWFAVPLSEATFAVGIVSRASTSGVVFGYFFGPERDQLPNLEQLDELQPEDAVLVTMFGDLGLINGSWRVIAKTAKWDPVKWRMPPFIRYESGSGRSFRVHYADDDPNIVMREEKILPGVAEHGPQDGLSGSKFVEKMLAKLLRQSA